MRRWLNIVKDRGAGAERFLRVLVNRLWSLFVLHNVTGAKVFLELAKS